MNINLSAPCSASVGATFLRSVRQRGSASGGGDPSAARERPHPGSAEDILARSRAIQPGQVVGLELERDDGRWIYEVKLIDERNRVHELELDAASGAVLEREEK